MIRLSYAITTIPERLRNAQKLLSNLPGAELILDLYHAGAWKNAVKAWSTFTNSTHHIVIQDDVEICANFHEQALKAVQACPDKIISFFEAFHDRSIKAYNTGHNWIRRNAITAQAVCIPVSLIYPWLAWCERNILETKKSGIDTRMCLYFISHFPGFNFYYTLPSLTQHIGAGKSSLGHRNPKWTADTYGMEIKNFFPVKAAKITYKYSNTELGYLNNPSQEFLDLLNSRRNE